MPLSSEFPIKERKKWEFFFLPRAPNNLGWWWLFFTMSSWEGKPCGFHLPLVGIARNQLLEGDGRTFEATPSKIKYDRATVLFDFTLFSPSGSVVRQH